MTISSAAITQKSNGYHTRRYGDFSGKTVTQPDAPVITRDGSLFASRGVSGSGNRPGISGRSKTAGVSGSNR